MNRGKFDLLTRCGPQLLSMCVCHKRQIKMPIREVATESARQMTAKEKDLGPENELAVLAGTRSKGVISFRGGYQGEGQ